MTANPKQSNIMKKYIYFLIRLVPKGIETDGKQICKLNEGKQVLYPDMSVCQQQVEPTLSERIQGLPPELREMIYKDYIKKRQQEVLRQRDAMGWDEVHYELLCAPFCEKNERNTKFTICRKCCSCEKNGLCTVCLKGGKMHYIHPLEWAFDEDETHLRYV